MNIHYTNILKRVVISLFALLLIVLVAATILEKIYGVSFAFQYIYHSAAFVVLWALLSLFSLLYIVRMRMYKRPFSLCLHLSFILILIGALFTHIYSQDGSLHLRKGVHLSSFIDDDGMGHRLPFNMSLEKFQIKYYSGSHSPRDYESRLKVVDNGKNLDGKVSMNDIFKYRGYRFYQSGFDEDECGTTLLVSYDPIGMHITYIGYATLFLSMLLFFFSPRTRFRRLINSPLLKKGALMLFLLTSFPLSSFSRGDVNVLPEEVAHKFDKVFVMYNGRLAPMQTLIDDYMMKIHGSSSYNGYSAAQVFMGFYLFPERWEDEKIIKIKDETIRKVLNIDDEYASVNDFFNSKGENKLGSIENNDEDEAKKIQRAINTAEEKLELAYMITNGEVFSIFPYSCNGEINWTFAESEILNDSNNKLFSYWMTQIKSAVTENNISLVDDIIKEIKRYQRSVGKDTLPSKESLNAELLYNHLRNHLPAALLLVTMGMISFVYFGVKSAKQDNVVGAVTILLNVLLVAAFLYISLLISLRWYIGAHIPLSNGFETMQFMAWIFIALTLILQKKIRMILSFGLILSGFALMVSTMGETNPQITKLVPVLSSPLLSIHVMVIMLSYSLLAFMMLNGVMAFAMRFFSRNCGEQIERLSVISNILLYPALFLLTEGVFIGAIWANISWGSYWAWDPKEVWALITMLIYSLALHQESVPLFKRTMFFHLFTIIAFLSVIVTYFGVNFFLGGMHSYA